MDWQISRPPDILWSYVRDLKDSTGSTNFHDIILYCSDGAIPWNRLLLGISLPSCSSLLQPALGLEVEVAVSLPDLSVSQAKEVLEATLPQAPAWQIHPALVPSHVSYTLVPGQEEDDILAGGYDSDVDIKPDITECELVLEEETSFRKQIGRKRKREQSKTSNQKDVHHSIFTEEVIQGKRQRKKKVFDDFEYSLQTTQPQDDEFKRNGDLLAQEKFDLEDIQGMKQLWMDVEVTLPKIRLTEEQYQDEFVDLEDIDIKSENEDLPLESEEALVEVDSTFGKPESEEVEQHITRFFSGEKIVKQCKICDYKTDRWDQFC